MHACVLHACVLHAGVLYPEEISAYVLCQLLEDAARFSGRPVGKAVISVPAYFNDSQREATVAAGKIAGLEAVKLIRCVPGLGRRFGGGCRCASSICC
jgi:heat shock protein 1/8